MTMRLKGTDISPEADKLNTVLLGKKPKAAAAAAPEIGALFTKIGLLVKQHPVFVAIALSLLVGYALATYY